MTSTDLLGSLQRHGRERLWAPGRRATTTFSLVREGTRTIDVKLSRTGPAIGGGILLASARSAS